MIRRKFPPSTVLSFVRWWPGGGSELFEISLSDISPWISWDQPKNSQCRFTLHDWFSVWSAQNQWHHIQPITWGSHLTYDLYELIHGANHLNGFSDPNGRRHAIFLIALQSLQSFMSISFSPWIWPPASPQSPTKSYLPKTSIITPCGQ